MWSFNPYFNRYQCNVVTPNIQFKWTVTRSVISFIDKPENNNVNSFSDNLHVRNGKSCTVRPAMYTRYGENVRKKIYSITPHICATLYVQSIYSDYRYFAFTRSHTSVDVCRWKLKLKCDNRFLTLYCISYLLLRDRNRGKGELNLKNPMCSTTW